MDTPKKSRRGLVLGLSAAAALGVAAFVGNTGSSPAASAPVQTQPAAVIDAVAPLATTSVEQEAPTTTATVQVTPQPEGSDLSNDRHYTNSAGHEVHSPAYDTDGDIPAGATARCGDGTYSFSESHRGTCSHHGGVSEWLQ